MQNSIQKIAVLRATNGLGDLLVCLPAVKALKEIYPAAEIILFGLPWHQQFITPGRCAFDRVIPVPQCYRVSSLSDPEEPNTEFWSLLDDESFDIVFNFQGCHPRSAAFIQHLGARLTVGHTPPTPYRYDLQVPYTYYQNEVLRYCELVSLVTKRPCPLDPVVSLKNQEFVQANILLKEADIKGRFIVFHPGATDPRRRWPAEKFIRLGDRLSEHNYKIVLAGDVYEKHIIDHIREQMSCSAVALYRGISLGVLAALQSKSSLVISNDTGPLHLARAVGASTIGLLWAPNVINWGPLSGHRHRILIDWELRCPKCGIMPNNPYPFEPKTAQCEHLYSFVDHIPVSEVLDEALKLLRLA